MAIQLSDHFTYRRLLRFAFPSILMLIFTSIYSVVDGLFISNFVGKVSFAAVNFIMPFLMVMGAVGFMIGAGGSALIAKTLGEGDRVQADRLFSFFIYFSIFIGVVLSAVGMVSIRWVATALGADESMLGDCVLYGRIILTGVPAFLLQFELQSFFVVAEKPKLGLIFTLAAGLGNIVLDALLVGILPLGLVGAAVATCMSEVIGGVIPLFYFARKNTSLLHLTGTSFMGKELLKASSNGFSVFLSNVSMPMVNMLYNWQLMKFAGQSGVAAYGVLMYVCLIFISIFIGYSVGTAPIVGFHFGAGNQAELKNLLHKSLRIMLIFAFCMLTAGELLARPLSALFVGYDEELMKLTLRGFRFFSFMFLFAAIPIFGSGFFTALNNGFVSAMISFLRTVIFQVAAVIVFPIFWGIDGIWCSIIAAEMVAALVTVFFLVTQRSRYNY